MIEFMSSVGKWAMARASAPLTWGVAIEVPLR